VPSSDATLVLIKQEGPNNQTRI